MVWTIYLYMFDSQYIIFRYWLLFVCEYKSYYIIFLWLFYMVFDLMIDVEWYEDNLLYEPVDITLECLKYTSNLLVRNILNPEIERASEELSDVIDVHAIDIFYMLQKDLLVKNRQALMWLLHDGTNCDIIAQIQNINKQILQFDATQELQKGLVYYTWDLQKWKMEFHILVLEHEFLTNVHKCYGMFQSTWILNHEKSV